MTRYLGAAVIGFLLAVPVSAQDYCGLRVAQEHLQAAWDSLKAAPADQQGHHDRAVGYVNKALEETHLALSGEPPHGSVEEERERRADDLEQRKELLPPRYLYNESTATDVDVTRAGHSHPMMSTDVPVGPLIACRAFHCGGTGGESPCDELRAWFSLSCWSSAGFPPSAATGGPWLQIKAVTAEMTAETMTAMTADTARAAVLGGTDPCLYAATSVR